MNTMEKLSRYSLDRPAELRRLKKEGTKVVGYFVGDFVPEELIYASGAVPVCLVHGGDPESVELAHSVTTRFLCPFARAQIGQRLLQEQQYYQLVDILIGTITCQQLRRVVDLWNHFTDVPVFRLGVPLKTDKYGLEYYLDTLRRLKHRLEELTGSQIKEQKLKEAIALYNRMRELLKKISLLRKRSQPPINTLEFIKLNHVSFLVDPNLMVEALESLYQELSRKEDVSPHKDRLRLLLTGPNIALGDYKVLDLVHEAGASVVIEEICEGVRYYWENVEPSDDLLNTLAHRYLMKRTPCAFMRLAFKRRLDFIRKLAEDFHVDGVLWYQLKYCETWDIEYHFFSKKLKEIGLPMLQLESEYDVSDRGQLKTRIEAFLEMIRQ